MVKIIGVLAAQSTPIAVSLALVRDEADINICRTAQGSVLTAEQAESYEDEALYFLVTKSTFTNGAIHGQL